METLSWEQLQRAVREGAVFQYRGCLSADGGDGGKIFPPTYAGGVYAVEKRSIKGSVVLCVLLDSVQSQANRMEEALQEAFLPNWREMNPAEEQKCGLPIVAVHVPNHGWITSLTAPHRIHDAILRDSNRNGTRFRDCDIGRDIVSARVHDATAFYKYCPTALLFGTWDSTAGEGLESAKIPRAVVSEIVGVNMTPGVRTGSRIDPLGIRKSATIYRLKDNENDWTLKKEQAATDTKGKPKMRGKGNPSDINHGNVTPDMPRFDRKEIREQRLDRLPDLFSSDGEIKDGAVKPGGVTIGYALHTWTLSLTQLRRLRFPGGSSEGHSDDNEERQHAARTVLAALAIYALALQKERGYWLRSRCELIANGEVTLKLLPADTEYRLPTSKGVREDLLERATTKANELNIRWESSVIQLTPTEKLIELVSRSDALAPAEESQESALTPEPEVTDDAGATS